MRIIKFRAWHKEKQKMYSVWGILNDLVSLSIGEQAMSVVGVSSVELMQFIGLTDCNDKEIYEGDILEIEDATAKVVFWERPPEFGLDFYHNEEAWCEDWNVTDDSERMEIIGNIYENPELLEPKP